MSEPTRPPTALVQTLASALSVYSQETAHLVRVGVEGPDAAGKTTFANQLAVALAERGLGVLRASIDGWHFPAEIRYRRGRMDPEGYYRDSFDVPRLRAELLDPLGPTGDQRGQVAIFDHETDSPVDGERVTIPTPGALVFDGLFLQRPELEACWDVVVYLWVDEETSLERGVDRDARGDDEDEIRERYLQRYLPGYQWYLEEVDPIEGADIVVDASDLDDPVLLRMWPLGERREVDEEFILDEPVAADVD